LVLVDLTGSELDGQQAEDLLHEVGITVNRNAVPNDPRPPRVTSGLRIGTPALATRGFGSEEFAEVADVIAEALTGRADLASLRRRTAALAASKPLYTALQQHGSRPRSEEHTSELQARLEPACRPLPETEM